MPLCLTHFSRPMTLFTNICFCVRKCVRIVWNSSLGNILSTESRLLQLKSPAYVFGDFHGNLGDLLAFARTMWPLGVHLTPGTFLFLGDYVDGGMFGLELLSYLFAQKAMFHDKVFLLRGNHEIRSVNVIISMFLSPAERLFAFAALFVSRPAPRSFPRGRRSHCIHGFISLIKMWDRTNQVFDRLPLAAVIDDVLFCVHGGIPRPHRDQSPRSIAQIRRIPAPFDPSRGSAQSESRESVDLEARELVSDLLWPTSAGIREKEGESVRSGSLGGESAVNGFLAGNGLTHVLRAHEATMEGVSVGKDARDIAICSTSSVGMNREKGIIERDFETETRSADAS